MDADGPWSFQEIANCPGVPSWRWFFPAWREDCRSLRSDATAREPSEDMRQADERVGVSSLECGITASPGNCGLSPFQSERQRSWSLGGWTVNTVPGPEALADTLLTPQTSIALDGESYGRLR